MQQFLPALDPQRTDVAGIANFPSLPECSCDEYCPDYESDNSSDLGGADGTTSTSLKRTEFSLKHVAKTMGQPNFSAFNKWKKVWVPGFLEKKHRSIIQGQNRLEHQRDGPHHWEMVVADVLETFKTWLQLDIFDNAEWIRQQWVEMFLMNCASEVRVSTKK